MARAVSQVAQVQYDLHELRCSLSPTSRSRSRHSWPAPERHPVANLRSPGVDAFFARMRNRLRRPAPGKSEPTRKEGAPGQGMENETNGLAGGRGAVPVPSWPREASDGRSLIRSDPTRLGPSFTGRSGTPGYMNKIINLIVEMVALIFGLTTEEVH